MRIRLVVPSVFGSDMSPSVRAHLADILPTGFDANGTFRFMLFADDPEAQQIRSVLEGAGIHHWVPHHTSKGARTFMLRRMPVFDAKELEQAKWLELIPLGRLDATLTTRRMIVIRPRELKRQEAFVEAWYAIVVHDKVRRALETQNFSKLKFAETMPGKFRDECTYDRLLDWSDHGGPWWELMSDVMLPKSRFDRFAEEYLQPGQPWDAPMDGRLHFAESDLAPLGDFDFACEDTKPYIVSQRFYQFCKAQGWNAEWRPVAIDPE